MSMFETLVVFLIGAAGGGMLAFALVKARHGAWASLPTGESMLLSVDRDGYGKLIVIDEMLPGGMVKIPGNGLVMVDPHSRIWLGKMKTQLFLHYADYFRTIPPKHGAFFSHFKGKKEAIEKGTEKDWESEERQEENQPGVVWDIKDVMRWVRAITPAHLLEGAINAATSARGMKMIEEEGSGGGFGNLLKYLLIGGLVIGIGFFGLMLIRSMLG